eukprot:COSAG01_NODE_225_length_21277_cov_71.340023_15_plen_99_part_00
MRGVRGKAGNKPSELVQDESIVDLWLGVNGGAEGPAHGLNNSIEGCFADNGPYCSIDPNSIDECRYEDALFRDFLVQAIKKHNVASAPIFMFYAPHIA